MHDIELILELCDEHTLYSLTKIFAVEFIPRIGEGISLPYIDRPVVVRDVCHPFGSKWFLPTVYLASRPSLFIHGCISDHFNLLVAHGWEELKLTGEPEIKPCK